jgi:cysteine sulfinate desulfinase/cysteine desulfurase-like protein
VPEPISWSFITPEGIGALIVRRGVPLEPRIHGAGHEDGRRADTEHVPSLEGLGAAADLAARRLPAYWERVGGSRDSLQCSSVERVPHAVLHGQCGTGSYAVTPRELRRGGDRVRSQASRQSLDESATLTALLPML